MPQELLNCKDQMAPETFYVFVKPNDPMAQYNMMFCKQLRSAAFTSLMNPTPELAEFRQRYLAGTIRYLPYEPCRRDLMALSPYCLTAINNYRIEYDIEVYRAEHFGTYPSRLSATFAFGDYETCEKVATKYPSSWPLSEVRKFRLIDHPLARVVKVNMEHVSAARKLNRHSSVQNPEEIWSSYWAGVGEIEFELPVVVDVSQPAVRQKHTSDVIWEYLIEGALELIE